MKKIVENITNNAQELEQYSQSDIKLPSFLPQGFLSQFTQPFAKVQNWAKSVTEFTQSCCQSISNLHQKIEQNRLAIEESQRKLEEIHQIMANSDQDFVERLRNFVEANR